MSKWVWKFLLPSPLVFSAPSELAPAALLLELGLLEEVVGQLENGCTTTSFVPSLKFGLRLGLLWGFCLEIFIACECALWCGLASWCVAFVPFGE